MGPKTTNGKRRISRAQKYGLGFFFNGRIDHYSIHHNTTTDPGIFRTQSPPQYTSRATSACRSGMEGYERSQTNPPLDGSRMLLISLGDFPRFWAHVYLGGPFGDPSISSLSDPGNDGTLGLVRFGSRRGYGVRSNRLDRGGVSPPSFRARAGEGPPKPKIPNSKSTNPNGGRD